MGMLKINYSENVAAEKKVCGINCDQVVAILPSDDDPAGESVIVFSRSLTDENGSEHLYAKVNVDSLCDMFAMASNSAYVARDLTDVTQLKPFTKKPPSTNP